MTREATDLNIVREKVERCRAAYETWMTRFDVTTADRNEGLIAYDAAQAELGKEWRAIDLALKKRGRVTRSVRPVFHCDPEAVEI